MREVGISCKFVNLSEFQSEKRWTITLSWSVNFKSRTLFAVKLYQPFVLI